MSYHRKSRTRRIKEFK